jgi:hypothetical protein
VDFISGLLCILGHVRQFLSKFLDRPWGDWLRHGFVLFVCQSLYPLFQLGMVALWGQELLRLMVCDLPL